MFTKPHPKNPTIPTNSPTTTLLTSTPTTQSQHPTQYTSHAPTLRNYRPSPTRTTDTPPRINTISDRRTAQTTHTSNKTQPTPALLTTTAGLQPPDKAHQVTYTQQTTTPHPHNTQKHTPQIKSQPKHTHTNKMHSQNITKICRNTTGISPQQTQP